MILHLVGRAGTFTAPIVASCKDHVSARSILDLPQRTQQAYNICYKVGWFYIMALPHKEVLVFVFWPC